MSITPTTSGSVSALSLGWGEGTKKKIVTPPPLTFINLVTSLPPPLAETSVAHRHRDVLDNKRKEM
jgi:hypothetical protein